MTIYLNLRSATVGGVVMSPRAWEGNGTASPPRLNLLSDADLSMRAKGKDVLIATHGFNVNYIDGACSLGHLEGALNLTPSEMFVGVLWPGDWWLPAVNYPFEGATAIKGGQKLAQYCNARFATARSLSFVSHSLGARLVLEAIEHLNRRARVICLTAAAINDDCLSKEYSHSTANSLAIATLSSRKDRVLQIAFPIGDLISDILNQDHAFGEPALGRSGPAPPMAPFVEPAEIPDAQNYDHGDYFPPPVPQAPIGAGPWSKVADYIVRFFRAEPRIWP